MSLQLTIYDQVNSLPIAVHDCVQFRTQSPINVEKLKGQNKALFEWLMSGQSIWFTHTAERQLGIGVLHSRISDLRNRNKISIQDRPKILQYNDGTPMHCKEYWIEKRDIKFYQTLNKLLNDNSNGSTTAA